MISWLSTIPQKTILSDNPLVFNEPCIRFYAGAPLTTDDGFKIGTLAVLDKKTRVLTDQQLSALRILSRQVVSLLNLRHHILQLKKTNKEISYLANLVEQTGDAIISIDKDERIKTWNRGSEILYGYKKEEVVGILFWKVAGQSQDYRTARFFEGETIWRGEVEHKHREGNKIYLLLTISSIQAADDHANLVMQIRDITAKINLELQVQNLNEEAIRQGDEIRKMIMDSALDAIICINALSTITFWNPQAERIFGWTENQILGKNLSVIIPEQYRIKHEKGMQRYTETGQSVILNNVIDIAGLNKSGKEFPIELAIIPLIQNGNQFFCAFIRDITLRKKSEQSLLAAEEQYRNIFTNIQEGVYQSTREGKFIAANPAMAKMLGCSSPEELMTSITDIGTQIYSEPHDRFVMQSTLEKEEMVSDLELKVYKKNKKTIWVRAHIRAIRNENGIIVCYEGTMEDITERKKAEDELKAQFEQLQKTNYELDKFVYSFTRSSCSFDFYTWHRKYCRNGGTNPTLQKYFRMIRDSTRRLDGFINDILDYSRNTRMDLLGARIKFREILAEIRNNLRLIQGAERLKVNLHVDDGYPFYSDRIRLTIILNNIFSNSIKYQDFEKENSFVKVQITTSQQQASIHIEDNGIGILPEHINRIFEMFYRASDTSKGSGLGLYIVQQTVAKLQNLYRISFLTTPTSFS